MLKTKVFSNTSRTRSLLAIIGGITVVTFLLGVVAILFMDTLLRDTDRPEHSDAIIALSGAPERTLYAADLITQGYAQAVYISKPVREDAHRLLEEYGFTLPREEQINQAILLKRGVAANQIYVLPNSVVNTMGEARGALAAVPTETKTIMIVTSAYHTRRTRMIFRKIFAGRPIKLIVVATPYEHDPERWWKTQESAMQTIMELAKVVFFLAGGDFSRNAISP